MRYLNSVFVYCLRRINNLEDNQNDFSLYTHIPLKDIKDILRNRVEVFNAEKKNISSITNLSTLPLYNSKLLLKAFDPNNFNPLLYEFDFYTKSTLVYRVDNTSYLIFIKPRELR